MRLVLIVFGTLAIAVAGAFFLLSKNGLELQIASAGPKTIGDWRIDCRDDAAAQCVASQRIIDGDRNAQLLQIEISVDGDGKHQLTAVTPLGAWLEPGVALQVGEGEAQQRMTFSFERCVAVGCVADGYLAAEQLQALYGREQAILFVADKERKIIGIPLSLNGFEGAVAALQGGKLERAAKFFQSSRKWVQGLIENTEKAE